MQATTQAVTSWLFVAPTVLYPPATNETAAKHHKRQWWVKLAPRSATTTLSARQELGLTVPRRIKRHPEEPRHESYSQNYTLQAHQKCDVTQAHVVITRRHVKPF